MKRISLRFSLMGLALGLICTAAFGQITTSPVIDGDGSDAVWASVSAFELLRDNGSPGVADAADFSANIKVLWNADTVFCLLEVSDDTLVTDLNQAWERDHYSIYFDLGNLKTTAFVKDAASPYDSIQFMVEKIWSVEGNLTMADSALVWGVDFVEVIREDGYTLEIAFPFSRWGVSLTAGTVLGFDAKVGDNDADGSLDGKFSLYQIMDEGWRNPSYLGTAMLEADGTISRVKHEPVIDGVADYPWYAADSYSLLVKNISDGVTNAADFSGTFKVMHNNDNVYVFLEVMDDTLITDLNQAWERDHYSIYFDVANLKTAAYVTDAADPKDSVQFMVEKVWSVAGDLAFEDSTLVNGVDFVEVIGANGYKLEIVFPFSEIGVTIPDESIIGFDVKIGDNDADGSLDGKYSWHQSADEGWRNPSYLGNLRLEPVFFDLGGTSAAPAQIETDGIRDGDWNHAIAMPLLRENLTTGIENAADFSGTIRALWDPEYIHIWLEVKDDTLVTDLNQPWERDHYSIYFDFGNLKTTTYVTDQVAPMDSVQFMLEKVWSVEGNLAMEDTSLVWGMDFVEVIDSNNMYILELTIPLALIGVDLNAGDVIGFDAKIGDNDADGNLDGKLSWNQFADEGWQNPSYLGEVTLMANGTFSGMPFEPNNAPEITAIPDTSVGVDSTIVLVIEVSDQDGDEVDISVESSDEGIATVSYADGMATITGIAVGTATITVTATDGEDVTETTFEVSVEIVIGIDRGAVTFSIYPNPATDMIRISGSELIRTVQITNVVGQQVMDIPVNAAQEIIDISSMDSGIYIVTVCFESAGIKNRVFVKQ
jgi:endo-1,4-beta-xylanase